MNADQSPEENLVGKVAWLYYVDGLTQTEIGRQLNLSRPKVQRLLQKARDTGIVEIRLASNVALNVELGRELERRFDLDEAVVTNSVQDRQDQRNLLGRAGAYYLERILGDDFVLGVGMGRTLASMLPHVTPKNVRNGVVMTVAGAFELPGRDFSAYNISWRLADLLGARIEQLYCPMVVADKATRDGLFQDRELKAMLDRVSQCHVVVVGVGIVEQDAPLVRLGYCESTEMERIKDAGAVGEIMGRFFDINGQPVRTDLEERIIGIDCEQLQNVPTVIALAGGLEKVEAILGVSRSRCLDVLITDQETAKAILTLGDENTK